MTKFPLERDLEKHFYSSLQDPQIEKDQKEVEELVASFVKKRKDNTSFQTDSTKLLEALQEYEIINDSKAEKPYAYIALAFYTNMNDKQIKATKWKIEERTRKIWQEIQFFELAIGKIEEKNQTIFLSVPDLQPYKHYLERIFDTAKHDLSEAEEKIISNLSKTSYSNRVEMLDNFLSSEEVQTLTESGGRETKSFNELFSLCKSTNQAVRDEAAKHINTIISKHINTAENEINSVLEYKFQIDKMRQYSSPESSRYISDDVEKDIVYPLIQAVQAYNHIAQDFYRLKAQLLGKEKLAYHERNVPVSEVDLKYTYEQGVELTQKVFNQLDPEFAEIFMGFVQEGRIDVFPKAGKTGGAFQASFGHSDENFIMLNYTNTLNDVTTLAHEAGHGIHSVLSKKHQNSLQSNYGMAVAEVASTFMEAFLMEEVMSKANQEEQFAILMEKLNDAVSTIHRQISLYQFEIELHRTYREKWFLSHEEIGKLFQKNMSAYMGDYVTQDPGSENMRTYRSHIRYFFYVYSYAGGIMIANALKAKVDENHDFIQQIKEKFLSAGYSKSPKDIFASMGIDITQKDFRELGLKEIEKDLQKAKDLAKELNRI